jgi:hypothetical protein
LFAEDPADGVTQVGLATTVGTYYGGDATPVEAELGTVAEGLEALEFDLFQLQHCDTSFESSGESLTILTLIPVKVKWEVYRMQ